MRNDLSDVEWNAYKKVYQAIANIYFSNNDSDDWHNAFIEVLEDIRTTEMRSGWPGVYSKLKQIKGDHV